MSDLSQQEWREKLSGTENAQVLDVRTHEEVKEGMIPGAIQLDIYQPQQFIDGLERLDKSKTYFVYCRVGGRSAQACAIMNQMGFEKAYNLIGGFKNWKGEITYPETKN